MILAHGALGAVDEIVFLTVAFIFVAMMVISWLRTRNLPPDEASVSPEQPDSGKADSREHFELR